MKRFDSKRLLAFMLAVTMIFSLLPTPAYAAVSVDGNTISMQKGETHEISVEGDCSDLDGSGDDTVGISAVYAPEMADRIDTEPATVIESGHKYVLVNQRLEKSLETATKTVGDNQQLYCRETLANGYAWTITAVEGGQDMYTVQTADGKYLTIGGNVGNIVDDIQEIRITAIEGANTWQLFQNSNYLCDFTNSKEAEGVVAGYSGNPDTGNPWYLYEVVSEEAKSWSLANDGAAVDTIEDGKQYIFEQSKDSMMLLANAWNDKGGGSAGSGQFLKLKGTKDAISDLNVWTVTATGTDDIYQVTDAYGMHLNVKNGMVRMGFDETDIKISKGSATNADYFQIGQPADSTTTWYLNRWGGAYLDSTAIGGWSSVDDEWSQWNVYEVTAASMGTTTVTVTALEAGETELEIGQTTYTFIVTDANEHNYDDNGFCTDADCGAYQPAVLNDEGVYEISNGGQLYWFAALVNGGETDADAILTDDITVNEDVLAEGALNGDGSNFRVWTPMGTSTNPYVGTFDGDEHTISGLYYEDTASTGSYVGLFGYLGTDATVQDTNVDDTYFYGYQHVGTISGYNLGTISGCSSAARVRAAKTSSSYAGGITGYSIGEVNSCTNTGTVSGYASVGGMVGYNYGLITDCVNNGPVTYEGSMGEKLGGIAGTSAFNNTFQGGIYRCVNTADVTGYKASTGQVGGIVGYLSGNGNHKTPVQECSNTGDVTGYHAVGGLVGYCTGATVENSYNTGDVTAITTGNAEAGGVVGFVTGTITVVNRCYSTGSVSGESRVGGAIGYDEKGGNITDCYYLAESESDELDGTTAKTEAQFASGEVTYLLNGSTDEGELVWKQTLETHGAPQFEGEVVHYNSEAESPYYNGEPVIVPDHHYDNGFCTDADCGAYQPAEQNDEGIYEISNGGQLYWFAALVNGGTADADAVLVNDIYVNQNVQAEGDFRAWTPIGGKGTWMNNYGVQYTGTFDGAGHTVSGLYFNDEAADYVGFIGTAGAGCSVKDLTLADSYIRGGMSVGGIVGTTISDNTITGCTNAATVQGSDYVGGIIGENYGADITDCVNTGLISGSMSSIGGIAGFHTDDGEITLCVNMGEVSAPEAQRVGGLVGEMAAGLNASPSVSDCYNNGAVSGKSFFGGVVGYMNSDDTSVTDCYTTTGVVVGKRMRSTATIENCYYLADSETDTYDGTTAKTEVQFASGEVTYLLNASTDEGELVWKQTLSGDEAAVAPQFTGLVVYNIGENAYSNETPVHEHVFDQEIATEDYLATDATCDQAATYYVSCACGEKGTDTFTSGEALGHDWADATCTAPKTCKVCGATEGETADHTYVNGFCSVCDGYEPAVLVDDVYQISNAGQLYWFADLVNTSGDDAVIDAVLTADIVVNEAPLSADSRAWNPIGYYKKTTDKVYYSGTFDGQGHTVSGLYCVKTKAENASDYVGMFGRVDRNGTVKNLGVVDSEFTGRNNVGGVAGGNYYGTITGCWNDSKISGNSHVGGVVGGNAGTVSNCYNSGTVTGTNTSAIVRTYTGGVAGSSNEGSVTNCYNIGEVNGQYTVAPVVDMTANNATIENCYYLADSETDSLDGTTAKTADQFASGEVTYLLNGSTDEGDLVWKQTLETDGAPKFKGEVVHLNSTDGSYYNGEVEVTHQHDYQNGFCSGDDCDAPYEPAELNDEGVYEISNGGQLYWFAEKVNAGEADIDAVLMNDIYVNQNVQAEGEFRAWTPINGYTGNFDGGERTISGLYFNDEGTDYVGLFGKVGTDGLIENVTLADSYLRGKLYVGGIVGQAEGANITNCHNSGTVAGSSYVGGVVGYIKKGLVTDCSNTGIITGTGQQVGGVAGGVYGVNANFKAIVSGCTNAGAVSGGSQVGGVVGHVEHGTVQNSSNSASVTATPTTGNAYAGGVVGYFTGTSTYNNVLKCYNTGDVTAAALGAGGVVGQFSGGVTSKIENCYNTGNVTNTGASVNGGIVGMHKNGQVLNCYNTGSVTGTSTYNGAIIGNKSSGVKVPANNYYLAESETDALDGTTFKTADAFASGEVAYLLNGSKSDESVVWKQTLTGENVDETPNFVGQTVYMGYISCAEDAQSVYSNDSTASATKPDHDWADATCAAPKTCEVCGATEGEALDHSYVNGFCSACDAYQPAVLADGVYQISNGGQLYWFAEKVNAGETDLDAILMNDIYVNTGVLDEEGNLVEGTYREWIPIGNSTTSFSGTFDGAGHTVSGLYFNNPTNGVTYVGLIGYLGGTVKNVTVADSYLSAYEYVGGIVGRTASGTEAVVENCVNKATVSGYYDSIGGIVGYSNSGTTVTECVNYGSISSTDYLTVGGIVGYNNKATISKCVNYGSVYAKSGTAGGIAGKNSQALIEYCINHGAISGDARYVGGIAGYSECAATNASIGIYYNYNLGSVKGSAAYVGALVGYQKSGKIDRNYYLSTGSYTDGKGFAQKGVGNATTGKATNDSALKYVGLTEEGFASGEATYNMNNGSRGNEVWHQTLGTDTYPTYTGTDIVNWGYSTCNTSVGRSYSNEDRYSSRPAHDWADATCEAPKTCNRCDLTEGEALGHAYGKPVFVWNDTTASATVTCANDAEHVVELDVTVTSVDTEGDCENAPYTTYTATAEYDGETYTAEKVVTGQLLECVDENDDHLCDVCGKELSECADEDDDHLCDVCDKELSDCADEDDDHLCDICGDKLSDCADEDNDHLCDICGKELSECADKDDDGKCDTCGADLETESTECPKDETCVLSVFTDAELEAWYHDGAHYCVEEGLMNGTGNNKFEPNKAATRAMLVTILWREEGSPKVDDLENPFTDVSEGQWFYEPVVWAYHNGVVNGTSATTFSPDKSITREQIATIMYRYSGSPETKGTLDGFVDGDTVSEFAVDAMKWAVETGLINGIPKGNDMLIAPRPMSETDVNGNATRAQVATILWRYLTK